MSFLNEINLDFYVKTNASLLSLVEILKSQKIIFVDTEFVRRSTYKPVLGIIQIATHDHVYIIDALSVDIMLLKSVFDNCNIEKYFYSAKQDVEILYNYFKTIPQNIHDIQVALTFTGGGDHVGMSRAMLTVLNVELDKESQFSDWTQRPLTPEQLKYAEKDVICIRNLYAPVMQSLKDLDRLHWYHEYIKALYADVGMFDHPQHAVKRLRFKRLNPYEFHILDALAMAREELAESYDIPRQHLVTDKMLEAIASRMPTSFADFKKILFDKKLLNNKKLHLTNEVMQDLYHAFVEGVESLNGVMVEILEQRMKDRLDIFEFSIEHTERLKTLKESIQELSNKTNIPLHYLLPENNILLTYINQPSQFWPPWLQGLIE